MARILVIEDSPENLELMIYLLQAYGHAVSCAGDGAAGIAVAQRERPDLIICDIHLPGMDGYAVARQLKTDPELRATPLLAVTALAMVGDRDKVLAAGFDGYLAKPIAPKRFLEQVDGYLQTPGTPPAPAATANAAGDLTAWFWHGSRAQLLIVDDSPINRQAVCELLEPLGYAMREAATVREGLALARQQAPDLILSDLHLPRESGFDFLRDVKADPLLAHIPFLVLSSSYWPDSDRQRALTLGARRFLSRPITPQALLAAIDACLPEHPEGSDGQHPHC